MWWDDGMRMRTIVAAAALGALLAGCTPVSRTLDGPVVIPQEIAWRYAMHCVEPVGENVGVVSLTWSNTFADIQLEAPDVPAADLAALEATIEACLSEYRYEDQASPTASIYERAELYEYYSGVTIPCLAGHGIDIEPVPREFFLAPDGGEPWNPYLGMDLPFDRLLELYRACPPRPDYLETSAGG
jgi:hypothetical protein